MRIAVIVAVVFVAFLGIFITMPAPVDPVAWQPPEKLPMTGPLVPNRRLQAAELLAKGRINGPEDVAVDSRGRVYAGTQEGRIVRLAADGGLETFAETGGRPLGMQFDAAENLIVCDSYKGLLSIAADGRITVLSTAADGVPFRFTDDLDIAADGRIYFTDASDRFNQNEYLFDLLEARPHGRLLRYDPSTRRTAVLLADLYFANGVALSMDEAFVLVNETYRYRITRYWLEGPKADTRDIFVDNLPGFPDNISSDRQGTFWLALFTVRNDIVDRLHPHPFLKTQLSKLPKPLWPKPQPYGFVVALDEAGRIIDSFQDPTGEHLREVTSVKRVGDDLFMGSLHNDRIGRLRLRR
ncbi:MAG: SMP-30/gluconolactonase/LRE family protein [Pseudomonadota bacterium]